MNSLKMAEDTSKMIDYINETESNARTYARDFQVVIQSGENARVVASDGNSYIDCLGGAGTLALGHNNPDIKQAMIEFLNSGSILHGLDLSTPVKIKFIKTLLDCFPKNFSKNAKIQFCGPTGADAVEASLKLFKSYTKRSTIIAFQGAYHGMSHGALSITGNLKAKKEVQSLMPDVHFMPYPYLYRCPFGIGNEKSIDINLNYFWNMLNDPGSGIKKPAAVIMEIIQGEGGCIPANDRWVRGIRKITNELDIPLIIDEIQTGFGRTGNMFAFEESGITPDAVIVSKAVGGGLPLSVLLYNKKYDTWHPGAHAGTFRGNQLAMAAGIATINYIKANELDTRAAEKGKYILKRFNDIKREYPIVGDVRGKGLMIGIEIIDPTKEKDECGRYQNSAKITCDIKSECFAQGLIIETGGRNNSVLRLLPPLTISDDDINEAINIIEKSIKKVNELVLLEELAM